MSEGLGNGEGSATYSGFCFQVGGKLSLICSLSMGVEDGVGGPQHMTGVTCWKRDGVVGRVRFWLFAVPGESRFHKLTLLGRWFGWPLQTHRTKQATINKLEIRLQTSFVTLLPVTVRVRQRFFFRYPYSHIAHQDYSGALFNLGFPSALRAKVALYKLAFALRLGLSQENMPTKEVTKEDNPIK